MRQHPVQCTNTAPGAKDRTTLPPNGQPYQRGSPPFDVGAPAPGAKGSGTKSPGGVQYPCPIDLDQFHSIYMVI